MRHGTHALHPSAWKGFSAKLDFRFTDFQEVRQRFLDRSLWAWADSRQVRSGFQKV